MLYNMEVFVVRWPIYTDGWNENDKGPSSISNFGYLMKIKSGSGLADVALMECACVGYSSNTLWIRVGYSF